MDRNKYSRDSLDRSKPPKSRQIGFKFKSNASKDKVKDILREIRSWKEVKSVEQIFKKTVLEVNDSLMNIYILFVKKDDQIIPILKRLKSKRDIEYVYLPPSRSP